MMKRRPNRFIVEVRGGVFLFLNRMTGGADGWWWGSDAEPVQVGPFVSSEEALADASRDMGQFEVRRWDWAELRAPDRPLPSHGCIIVIDTGGNLWCKHGESPPAGWEPRQ
jgi:hypothetical protein